MKKLVFIFAMFLFAAAFFTGCAQAQPSMRILNPLPWSNAGHFVRETSTYEIRRYFNSHHNSSECEEENCNNCSSIDRELINIPEKSRITYTLSEGYSLDFPSTLTLAALEDIRPAVVQNVDHTLLQMEMIITYPLSEYPYSYYNRISSYSVFNRHNLSAVFSWRNTSIADPLDADGEFLYGGSSYQLWIDYRADFRTAFLIYYPTACLTPRTNQNDIPNATGIGVHFCNEYLFFLLRALESTSPSIGQSASQNIDFFLPLSNLRQGDRRIRPMTITQTTTTGTTAQQLYALRHYGAYGHTTNKWHGIGGINNDLIRGDRRFFDVPLDIANNDNPRIARRTSLRLDANRSGPDIELFFSAFPVLPDYLSAARPGVALDNVLLQVITHTYGMRGGRFDSSLPIYTQVFSLIEYTNTQRRE